MKKQRIKKPKPQREGEEFYIARPCNRCYRLGFVMLEDIIKCTKCNSTGFIREMYVATPVTSLKWKRIK